MHGTYAEQSKAGPILNKLNIAENICCGKSWLLSCLGSCPPFFSNLWLHLSCHLGIEPITAHWHGSCKWQPPGPTPARIPGNGLSTHPMGMCRWGLCMCVFHLYKSESSPGPWLTFCLTMPETTSQSTIPWVDTHWVSGLLNTFIVELLLSYCSW